MNVTVGDATPQEARYLRMLNELHDAEGIEVSDETVEIDDEERHSLGVPMARRAEEFLLMAQSDAQWDGFVIDPQIAERGLRFFEIGSYWRCAKPLPKVSGEFFLRTFFDVLVSSPPKLAWKGTPEGERVLYSQFRVIDSHPKSGSGLLAAVRIQTDTTPLEIWVWDARLGAKKMDLDYCGYLDALLLTKGAYGWQYLFTDVSLADDLFRNVTANLTDALEILPRLFPDGDYASLVSRLEARL
ncbi:hypothetical protein [Streptomyces guryensis]|uniref:Uncharacterized protein n=1 Tax=Streptomyces guryensis TaxID=2886947 RepID=A0A9Q3Z8R9_9ACTN|nr:hypothetical protein [Streptomyces guryensis]MCD9877604.1 hypothetical protein [Streptomyces guryensis]